MNNNYPDYNKYHQPPPPKPREEPPRAPPPQNTDDDYCPCLYSTCPTVKMPQQQQQKQPKRYEEPEQRKPQVQSFNYYFNPGSMATVSNASYADEPAEYAGYEPQPLNTPKIPSPPPPPKVIQVGHIVVRNNVEDDQDYAENVNRDIGTADPAIGSYGGADNTDSDYQTGIPDQTSFESAREQLSMVKNVKRALAKKQKNTCSHNSITLSETPKMAQKSVVGHAKLVTGMPRK